MTKRTAVVIGVGAEIGLGAALCRRFASEGLHVVIDGGIDGERLRGSRPEAVRERGEDGLLNIEAIAETYWQIHRQARSAWTYEIDLRPFKEPF